MGWNHRWSASALAVSAAVMALIAPAQASFASSAVPYTDANAVGYLGLCDAAGRPVQAGSLDDTPFIGTAVSSSVAPADYASDGRTATLFAFQPRRGLAPGEWSGEALGASTRYTNPTHPIAKLVDADAPLREFVNAFPPRWDGLLQLRVYLGAPNQPPHTQPYAATDIRIAGSRWSVVRGGDVACDSGQATSIAELLPSADPSKSVAQALHEQQAASTTTGAPGPGELAAPPAAPAGHAAAPPRSRPTHVGLPFALLAVVAATAVVLTIARRRRARSFHPRHR